MRTSMRTRGVALVALTAANVVAFGADACSSKSPASSAPAADSGANEWVIGVSNSLTGSLGSVGAPLHDAWSVAQDYVNANGGVGGRNIRFYELDDGSDDATQSDDGGLVTRVAEQLLRMNVAAVIGPNGSSQVQTVQGLFFNRQVLEITATATSTFLTGIQPDSGRFLFRTVPADDLQGRALARLATLGPGGLASSTGGDAGNLPGACTKMALFYYSNAYGAPMAATLLQYWAGTVTSTVTVDSTLKADYSTEVQKIADSNPECLAMIVYDDVGDAFLRQLTQTVTPVPFWIMGTDGVYDDGFIKNGRSEPNDPSSPTVVEGVYGTNPDTDPPDSPDYQFFKELYTLQHPLAADQTDVPPYASNEFDAAMLIALAIEQAGGADDRVKLRDALIQVSDGTGAPHGPGDFAGAIKAILQGDRIDYSGASGPCMINPATGGVSGGYILWHVENGAFVTLKHLKATDL